MSNFTSKGKKSIQGGTNIMIKDRQTKRTTTEKKKKKEKKKRKKMSLQMDWSKEEV